MFTESRGYPNFVRLKLAESWASYQIHKIACCACAGNAGNVFPCGRLQTKPLNSDLGMHHGTYVTHVSWCMPGSLTRGGGENVPGIPGACAPAILRIWQEAHGLSSKSIPIIPRSPLPRPWRHREGYPMVAKLLMTWQWRSRQLVATSHAGVWLGIIDCDDHPSKE